jgi:serine/threonine protein kinase
LLHESGFVYPDIKPGNFLLQPGRESNLVLIDFGLSKRYIDDESHLFPGIPQPGFNVTLKYASLLAQRGKDD